ncbi:hypothetical protein BCR34DRAFT_601268 [Clohesyomyces aquaticus]|uniref:Uncharacterized protein n=1 Tax=Clohesyomyces aquaticus TaxID=1231657 RepID=A0A1Y1ZMK4_9PLEO|nr:hypothetical protein BCR34DRAFT_601268 [Clohesyomyces aquaticus]
MGQLRNHDWYKPKADDRTTKSDVEAQLFNEELRELFEEYICSWFYFHYQIPEDNEYQDEDGHDSEASEVSGGGAQIERGGGGGGKGKKFTAEEERAAPMAGGILHDLFETHQNQHKGYFLSNSMTKASECFPEWKNIKETIESLPEHPFPVIRVYMQKSQTVSRSDESIARREYQKYLVKTAQYFYVQLQAEWAKQGMPDMTQISALRQYLLELPAEANYRNLQTRIFETLLEIAQMMERMIKKHPEDAVYADMRRFVEMKIPVVYRA